MKNKMSKQCGNPSNHPGGGDVFTILLDAMSVEELTDGLNVILENMTEENYDSSLIDAYLAALDRKDPIPQISDSKSSLSDFYQKTSQILPVHKERPAIFCHRLWYIGSIGLIASVVVICLMSSMVVAQAAGLDVFGALAHWTDKVFSLGTIQSIGADDEKMVATEGVNPECNKPNYTSLQEALDEYNIAEFSEPTWFPEEYTLEDVKIDCWPNDGALISIVATYSDGTKPLYVTIEHSPDESYAQMEKTDAPIETFVVNGITVYLLENISNNSAAWATENYEFYISGSVEKQVLEQIVLSAYAHS